MTWRIKLSKQTLTYDTDLCKVKNSTYSPTTRLGPIVALLQPYDFLWASGLWLKVLLSWSGESLIPSSAAFINILCKLYSIFPTSSGVKASGSCLSDSIFHCVLRRVYLYCLGTTRREQWGRWDSLNGWNSLYFGIGYTSSAMENEGRNRAIQFLSRNSSRGVLTVYLSAWEPGTVLVKTAVVSSLSQLGWVWVSYSWPCVRVVFAPTLWPCVIIALAVLRRTCEHASVVLLSTTLLN